MTETQITTTPEHEIEYNAPNWYQTWRDRIHQWVENNSDELIADIVLFVPDMLMLTVRLIKDKRVPFLIKAQLILSVAYVISPFDLIPEALGGVIGLVDDAGVLALTLYWLRNVIAIDPKILKDNWGGENDLNDVIQSVHQRVNDNANQLFSGEIWTSLRQKFDKSEDPPHQNQHEEQRPDETVPQQMGKKKVPIEIDFK
jgi:uncharacterized membrane protein YkvA (DUF1232 family)